MINLSLEEFLALSQETKHIAVLKEINLAAKLLPNMMTALINKHKDAVSFEDFQHDPPISYLNFKAFVTYHANALQPDLFAKLKAELKYFKDHPQQAIADRVNLVMGFLSYDAIRQTEKIPDRHVNAVENIPDIYFNFYRVSLAFNHQTEKLLLSVLAIIEKDAKVAYESAQLELVNLQTFIEKIEYAPLPVLQKNTVPDLQVFPEDNEFFEKIVQAKKYIAVGDAFQIVLSRTFSSAYSGAPSKMYEVLKGFAQASFLFYLPFKDRVFMGASPERLLSVQQNKIMINPIAGTRKNDNANTLLQDEKEVAEHMMLVDLARNDVSMCAIPGSLKIESLLQVKHYSHVTHLTSTISATLNPKYDLFNVLMATFPAGTLSGAPKIRAMEIIDELEDSRRGLYGGAIFRIDLQGHFDSCIAIRMAQLKENIASVRTGAGIVYDSNPELEVKETQHKAAAILAAIQYANELPS